MKYLLLIALTIALGCSEQKKFTHPNPSKLPNNSKIDYVLDITDASQRDDMDLHTRFSTTDTINLKSEMTLNQKLNFGGFKIIRSDIAGNIYGLNSINNAISVYDKTGKFKYYIGRTGRGPGEFNQLKHFSFSRDFNYLYALDQYEVEVFKFSEEKSEYIPYKSIFTDLNFSDSICAFDNSHIYISGVKFVSTGDEENKDGVFSHIKSSPTIHKLNLESETIDNSFGFVYESYSGSPVIDGMLSKTAITCNIESKTIVAVLENFGYIFGFSDQGGQKWITKIENYKSPEMEEINVNAQNAGITPPKMDRTYNSIVPPVSTVDTNLVLVQVINRKLASQPPLNISSQEKPPLEVITIKINTETGTSTWTESIVTKIESLSDNSSLVQIFDNQTQQDYLIKYVQ